MHRPGVLVCGERRYDGTIASKRPPGHRVRNASQLTDHPRANEFTKRPPVGFAHDLAILWPVLTFRWPSPPDSYRVGTGLVPMLLFAEQLLEQHALELIEITGRGARIEGFKKRSDPSNVFELCLVDQSSFKPVSVVLSNASVSPRTARSPSLSRLALKVAASGWPTDRSETCTLGHRFLG